MKINHDCADCAIDEHDEEYCSNPKHPGNFGLGFDCTTCRDYARKRTKAEIQIILRGWQDNNK